MQSLRELLHNTWMALAAGTHPAQKHAGTRGRGSRHPRLKPTGHQAKRRRLRKLQKLARRANRESNP